MLFGIRGIEESSVYQWILAKGMDEGRNEGRIEGRIAGRIENAREILLCQGRMKLGPPGENVEAEISAIADLDRLHTLIYRILNASTWDELLSPSDPSI